MFNNFENDFINLTEINTIFKMNYVILQYSFQLICVEFQYVINNCQSISILLRRLGVFD